jgi:hypothetical protein
VSVTITGRYGAAPSRSIGARTLIVQITPGRSTLVVRLQLTSGRLHTATEERIGR